MAARKRPKQPSGSPRERLIARLADPSVAPREFLFAPSLTERESVAAPGAAARGARQRGDDA